MSRNLITILSILSILVILSAGCTGAVGPAGLQGQAGPQGPSGIQGPAGAQGDRGPTGPTGPAGAVGPQGQPGVFSEAQLRQIADIRTDLNAFASAYGIPIGNATAMKNLIDERAVIEAAKKEGKLVIYTSTVTPDAAIYFLREAFERRYPEITVEFVIRTATATANSFVDDFNKGVKRADVITLGQAALFDILRAAPNSLAQYVPRNSEWLPADFKAGDGKWIAPASSLMGVGYNTRLVPKAEAPKLYTDLLDPKWKGKIVATDPKTTAVSADNWKAMEKEFGEDFIRRLAAQDIKFYSGTEALSKLVAGNFSIYLNTQISTFESNKIAGDPVDWVRWSDNRFLGQLSWRGISVNAPHPNAAKLWLDFLLTKEAQQIDADRGNIPNMGGLRLSNPDLTMQGKKLIQLDHVFDEERSAFLAAFSAKYNLGFPP